MGPNMQIEFSGGLEEHGNGQLYKKLRNESDAMKLMAKVMKFLQIWKQKLDMLMK